MRRDVGSRSPLREGPSAMLASDSMLGPIAHIIVDEQNVENGKDGSAVFLSSCAPMNPASAERLSTKWMRSISRSLSPSDAKAMMPANASAWFICWNRSRKASITQEGITRRIVDDPDATGVERFAHGVSVKARWFGGSRVAWDELLGHFRSCCN